MAIQGSNFNNFLNGLSKKEKDIYIYIYFASLIKLTDNFIKQFFVGE